jgi:long-chain fatty acid transport protein
MRMRATSLCQRGALLGLAAASALLVVGQSVQAGGFAVREQSAQFQGSSFAGNAAGGALSSMFWNPAAVGQFSGINTESVYSVIFPESNIHALAPESTLLGLGASADSGNIGVDALVPASYGSMQLSPNLVLGLSLNAPFGLTTKPENRFWAGFTQATTSQIKTYNLQSALAYRVAPGLIIGAGLQVELIEGKLMKAQPVGGPLGSSPNASLDADDIAVGFTAGVLWSPNRGTSIGLGFRSSIDHDLEGGLQIGGQPAFGKAGVTANVKTPETVTLSLRQALTPQITGLATVEWANWSRLQSLDVYCTTTGPLCPGGPGSPQGPPLFLGWHDGWFIAAGLEYAMNASLTLRTGLAWEKSPIQNPEERTVRIPDSDRIWASVGASWKINANMSLDFGYSHIFAEDARIDRTEPVNPIGDVRLLAETEGSVDIVSVGFKYKFGARSAESLK